MLTYEQAKSVAISKTIPDGGVYCSGDAGAFYYFVIVKKEYQNLPDLMTGSTYTAVDKSNGRVWIVSVTDLRLKGAKKIEGPKKG